MINHLWQSTVFAILTAILTLAFRKNRAQVRYWLWFSASIKFLLPFSLLLSLGSHLEWTPTAQATIPVVSSTMVQFTQPFPETVSLVPSTTDTPDWIPMTILGIWVCGFAAVALMRLQGWLRVWSAVRASSPLELPAPVEVRSSPGLLEPGVVGFLRPILLLPEGIAECLTPRQLEAVLAHELCHVRRRDNLTSAIHMIVEAVFWFHPLVWWIGARLVDERERACDEAVLSLGNEPQVYAEGILNVCKIYVESPLRCVSGVTGSDLKRRIQAILTGRVAGELTFAKKVALEVAGIAALVLPIIVGILNAPAIRAQSSAGTPKFEVASIKPCKPADGPQGRGGAVGNDPGRTRIVCQTVERLIQWAYVQYANGQGRPEGDPIPDQPIEGGPSWLKSQTFTIDAKPENPQTMEIMRGPMLKALLEDRFKLKIHRGTRQVPIYALVVAKGGPRLDEAKKDSCTAPPDFSKGLPPPLRPDQPPPCGAFSPDGKGGTRTFGQTLAGLSAEFSALLGRLVADRTGIEGTFAIHLEVAFDGLFTRFDGAPAAGDAPPADPFEVLGSAVQKLGLRLQTTSGPETFIVIDHVERPTEN